ncbi:MAG: galactose-1-phosphate uridylyltransferase [Elusimicrobia bacterium]|nr:galactose-1-phosphate uridylyltransferase [Elusimicrobiota bacterium]
MPELRRDPIIGRWVIISKERSKRPIEFSREEEQNSKKSCPLCPGNEKVTPPEIFAYGPHGRAKDTSGWTARVVPNKYPILQIEGALNRQGDGMYDKMNGVGAHEVIIESPDHEKEIPELPKKQVEDIIWVYKDRIIDLKKDVRLEYILIFKNRGAQAGATLSHPHSQLIATPIIPKRVREEIIGAKNHYDYKERCVFCDIMKQEISSGQRVVAENDHFIAFCPFASRFPFETWILPKFHSSKFEDIHREEASNLAGMLQTVLGKIDKVLERPPFNYIIHNSPLKEPHMPYAHWYLEIIPKLTQVAGFEWGSGFYVNPTPPEEAAKFLKESE